MRNARQGGISVVTVIIIFLNAAQYLEEAIDSVFRQTVIDWELVLIDDGSTDGSTNIAKEASMRRPDKVHYAHHSNHATLGTSASRNLGLQISRGDFVTFLDSDDLLFPENLEVRLSEILARPHVGAVFGPGLFVHCDPLYDQAIDSLQDLNGLEGMEIAPPFLLIKMLKNEGIHPQNNSILIRKSLAVQLGGFERDFTGMYEDTVFLAKLFLTAPVYVSPSCTAIYRLHWKSLCHQAIKKGSSDSGKWCMDETRRAFLEWLERYLARNPGQLLRLRLAVSYQLLQYRSSIIRVIHLGLKGSRGLVRRVTRRVVFFRRSSGSGALSSARLNRTLNALSKVEEFYRETQRPIEQWKFSRRRVSIKTFLTRVK
jgi:GT2 family glycosyltransferase